MQATTKASSNGHGTALLAFADGRLFEGQGFGSEGLSAGELVFNTAMTGYQEILSDPSYSGQLITFTCPHIGNTGVNSDDDEAAQPAALGLLVRSLSQTASNWRQTETLARWCERHGLIGLAGIDTRRIAHILRDEGAQNAAIAFMKSGRIEPETVIGAARAFRGLDGLDLVPGVTARTAPDWSQADWEPSKGYGRSSGRAMHIVVIDYGVKHNILRMLAALDCRVSVVKAGSTFEAIMSLEPDGIVLSNGPGDPAATGLHAVPVIQKLIETGKPIMGICLGHQMLGLAVGATTMKMAFGHHGANHPVKDLETGRVEITSQNHGFAISDDDLPSNIDVTHRSLFDGTIQGLALKDRPVYSVQFHPEASPGPSDSRYLFKRFIDQITKA